MDGREMKNIWVIANWKSNKNIKEALEWLDVVGPKIPRKENLKVVVCPPFTDIEEVKKNVLVSNYPIMVGAQDLSPFESGPYTGEESARILAELVDLAVLGHSERRQNFGETDETVAKKTLEAQKQQIIPLVCVQDEKTPLPEGIKIVAYEPFFAIGSGHPDTPQNANEVALKLKERNDSLEILYGGSITSKNSSVFLKQDNLNGLLVGQASLDPEEFIKIIQTTPS